MKKDKVLFNKKAVTLIEILISFFILVIAAFGAAGIMSQGFKATGQDSRRGEALQLLVDRMNNLSSVSFDKLSGKSIINSDFNGIKFGDSVSVGKNKYKIIANIESVSITFTNLKELDFTNEHTRIGETSPVDYVASYPETWFFKDRPNETINDQVLKIKVSVTPVDVDQKSGKDERTYEAITFVCKMD